MPFSRDRRAVAYQRAKMALDVRPFGTHYDATLHERAEMTAAAGFDRSGPWRRSLFLPSEAGEVSPTYGDGGVMIHERFAP
jgi:hypothetical protein